MNENPLASGVIQSRHDDVDLFDQALSHLPDDHGPASDASLVVDDRPRLTLVRPEDYEESSMPADFDAPSDHDIAQSASNTDLGDDEEYGELWLEHASDIKTPSADVNTFSTSHSGMIPEVSEDFDLGDMDESLDHFLGTEESSAGCITNTKTEAPAEVVQAIAPAPVEPTPIEPVSKPTIALGLPKQTNVPQRIGSGKLAATKLTWKPGDPFGCSTTVPKSRFRWELMLTTACVTAISGLACIWLLRTILT